LRARFLSITSSSVVEREHGEVLDGLSALLRCVRTAATATYATFEVGSTQAKLLRHIGRNSRISQADLARATLTDPALTGRALETLMERGWVKRTRSEEDRRQYLLELTASGQRARKRVDGARQEISDRIAAALDERDRADFDRIAKKIFAVFEGPAGPGAKP
jgi:DNA-binding MarR family transcriptional regulator